MRVAVAMLSLVLVLLVGLQSCAISFGAALGEDDNLAGAGAVGIILIALLFLLGGAFAVGYPLVPLIALVVAGLFGLSANSWKPPRRSPKTTPKGRPCIYPAPPRPRRSAWTLACRPGT